MDKFSSSEFFTALLLITLFLFAAYIIKNIFLKQIIIPPSLIGGILALIFGPEALGPAISELIPASSVPTELIPEATIGVWKDLPGYWIVVVFAGLFLGREIPSLKQILQNSVPNLSFGYTLALGQYVVGLVLAGLLLEPVFGIDVISGALIAIGFQGGHGTVAGLQSTFTELNFSGGFDLGLGIATIGLISAIVFGTIMSNVKSKEEDHDMKIDEEEDRKTIEIKKVSFPLQMSILGVTIILGWLILKAAVYLENIVLTENGLRLFKYMPLFPVTMMAGLLIQVIAKKFNFTHYISRSHVNFISNLSLDLLIVAALGSLSLETLANNIEILLILGGAGIAYNILIYFILAKRFFDKDWKYKGLGELGQSMGTTAIGLILIKKAGAKADDYVRSFSYKQPLYEPIVGGGLVTGISLPLIRSAGPWYFAAGMFVIILIILSLYFFAKKR